jgi:magnesium transporter
LNFIAGVYGMNFEQMPLVKSAEGFWVSIGIMIFICVGLLIYVVQKGWLSPPPKD